MFYGLGQWSIVAESIIVVVAWSVVYNSFNTKGWVRYLKPAGVGVVLFLLVVDILQDAFRQSVVPSKRGIFSTIYSVVLLVVSVAVCAGFLIYGRRLYRALSMFKQETSNVKHMRKLTAITTSVAIVALVIAIVIAIASLGRIFFRAPQNFLVYA